MTTEPYKKIKIYNPLSRDFTVTYDIHGDGEPVSFTILSQEIQAFEEPIAEHIKKHLAYEIAIQTRGRGTFEDARDKALRRIEVKEYGNE